MATLTVKWYGKGLERVKANDIDLVANTIKAALTTSAYSPNQSTHEFFDTHVTNEVAGTGYTAGGATLANKAINNSGGLTPTWDADDVVWNNSTITARNVVLYVDGATPGTDDFLVGYGTLAADESSEDGDFTITWHNDGILRITAS